MRKPHLLGIGALVLAASISLSACAGSGGGSPTAGNPLDDPSPAPANIRVWLVGPDTPQTVRDYLKQTFEAENPGSTLTVEEQSWTGLVDKYTTALSGSDAPDVVEIGNTQAPTFTSAGYFTDLTSKYQDLGGDNMLPGFVAVGSYNGEFYAPPYYSGARLITYTSQVFTGPVPTTWDEYIADYTAAATDSVSGLYLSGKDWRNGMTFVWANGGEIATVDASGKWTGGFASDASIKGLTEFQDLFTKGISKGATDVTESTGNQPAFCAGQVAFLQAASWVMGGLEASETAETPGCGSTYGNPADMHQFAIPGMTAGTYAPVLAGGSNLAIPAKSQHQALAYKALQIMLSDGYQKQLAAVGMVPALTTQAQFMPDNESSKASGEAASNAKLTPASPNWADVESSQILEDGFSKIAQGQDVATVAADMDSKMEAILNQ